MNAKLRKFGKNRSGSQRYKCVNGHVHTPIRKKKYTNQTKERVIKRYVRGKLKKFVAGRDDERVSLRSVAQEFDISPQTVANWVNEYREEQERLQEAVTLEEQVIEFLFELDDPYKT